MSHEAVVGLVSALWPVYTGGDRVQVERLARSASCPVRAMLCWDGSAWRVLVDQDMSPKALLVALGHELAHVVNRDLGKGGTGGTVVRNRLVFTGQRSLVADVSRREWFDIGRQAETARDERDANTFAVAFYKTWRPVLDMLETWDQAVDALVRKRLREVKA